MALSKNKAHRVRIAMIARATLYSAPGGDTTQVLQTAVALRQLYVTVDVYQTNAVIPYDQYDVLHFFNIIRPADIMRHTAKTKILYVVSTIYVEYSTIGPVISKALKLMRVFGADGMEYIKAIARWIRNGERIGSLAYLLIGHYRAIRRIATHAAMLLPNSRSEYHRLAARYQIARQHRIIPNGINGGMASRQYLRISAYQDAIICIARIEPIKNQLRLITALRGSGYRLFIHGKASPNHSDYYAQCVAVAGDDCTIGEWLDGDDLYSVYASAKVHVLPSYFETTGLSSLEAAVMGCNVVVTDRGDTREYFGNDAWYCDPDSPESIRAAVDAAFGAPYDEAFRTRILQNYTWQRAAEETLAAYETVLNKQ